jgi:uncharacterized protein
MSVSSGDVRATVDTNLFVSAALRDHGIPGQIRAAWRREAFILVTSAELEGEVVEVFQRPELARRFRLPENLQAELLLALAGAEHVRPLSPLPVHVRDPKDDKVLACALGGRVDYLVTGDPDLLALADEPAIGELHIITPRGFLVVLGITPTDAGKMA